MGAVSVGSGGSCAAIGWPRSVSRSRRGWPVGSPSPPGTPRDAPTGSSTTSWPRRTARSSTSRSARRASTSIQDADVDTCLQYDQVAERDAVRRLPEVAGAHRAAVRTGVMARAGDADPAAEHVIFLSAMLDPGMATPLGRPIVVGGRLAAADAPDEVMVNEAFLRQYDVSLGDRLRLQAFAAGETEQTPVDQRRSPAVEAQIVGVVRTLQDLERGQRWRPGEGARRPSSPARGSTGGWSTRPRSSPPSASRPVTATPRWRAARSTGRSRTGRSTTSTAPARTTRCPSATPTTTRPRPRWRSPS